MNEKDKKTLADINKNLPRGSGKFSVISDIIYVTASINGQTIRKSTGKQLNSKNKEWLAKQKPKAMLLKILGTHEVSDPNSVTTLAVYGQSILNKHIKHVKNSEYKKDVMGVFDKYIEKEFGDFELSQITVSDIVSFLKDIKKTLSVSRAKFIKNIFSMILDYANDESYIDFNPFNTTTVKKIKFPKKQMTVNKAYTDEEVHLILENATGWFKVFLDIAFKTGARTGEIMALKWSDIDLDKGTLHIQRTMHKGTIYEDKRELDSDDESVTKNHNRKIILMESTLELLRQFNIVKPHEEWVFPNRYKKPYSEPKNISEYYFKPLLKFLKIEYKTIYATRSTYISLLLNNGASLEQVQANVGHQPGSKVTQSHYHDKDNVSLEKKKSQAQKLEDTFNSAVANISKKDEVIDGSSIESEDEENEIIQEELSDETCK